VFERGAVRVRRHNVSHKDSLPSAVWIKKDKIIVGDKALEQAFGPNSSDVAVGFKRKMGTAERLRFHSTDRAYSPVDLSALLLKELRERHLDGDPLEAAVITVPASFDLRQSSATVEAGRKAGIRQVVLLQEPIAASLAYANMVSREERPDRPWLVYDLGGGTFDAAIVQVTHGELKVLDHEGDNYLGGMDIDQAIVEEFIYPRLVRDCGLDEDDIAEFTSAAGRYRRFYGRFRFAAEEAKRELSVKTSATLDELEFGADPDDADDFSVTITRSDFEGSIRKLIDRTLDLVKRLMTRNQLRPADLAFVLMVGGSTYIPYVRSRVGELLGIPVRHDVDPVAAIGIGAANFAATRAKDLGDAEQPLPLFAPRVSIKLAYTPASEEAEEILAARVEGQFQGLFYRIEREDGGFDSGLKPLTERLNEDLPLVPNSFNVFRLKVVDERGSIVEVDVGEIAIAHGTVIARGQPLTDNLCLEVDDLTWRRTKLEEVFQRGIILPAKKQLTLAATKSLVRGSRDTIEFRVCEGSPTLPPNVATQVGVLEIRGTEIDADIRRGSQITCSVRMDENRTLTVVAEIDATDQRFEQIFDPGERQVKMEELEERADEISQRICESMAQANTEEAYERSQQLKGLQRRVEKVRDAVLEILDDDLSDRRYQLDDQLREIATEYHGLENGTRSKELRNRLDEVVEEADRIIGEDGNDLDRRRLADAQQQALAARAELELQTAIEQVESIRWGVLWRSPKFLVATFQDLGQNYYSRFSDRELADAYIQSGRQAIANQDWMRVHDAVFGLIRLLPDREHQNFHGQRGIAPQSS
jgi:molecular chaperone DnaK